MDAFLKESGDRGRGSPDHVRFLSYTTRYNKSHWVSFDGMEKHYERAEVDARRDKNRKQYDLTTKNLTRIVLREMNSANSIKIDGRQLRLKHAAEVSFEKVGQVWKVANEKPLGLRKTHALQGPISIPSSSCVPPERRGTAPRMSRRRASWRDSIASMRAGIALTLESKTIKMSRMRTSRNTTSRYSATRAAIHGSRA